MTNYGQSEFFYSHLRISTTDNLTFVTLGCRGESGQSAILCVTSTGTFSLHYASRQTNFVVVRVIELNVIVRHLGTSRTHHRALETFGPMDKTAFRLSQPFTPWPFPSRSPHRPDPNFPPNFLRTRLFSPFRKFNFIDSVYIHY
jgi:hypothetical protein